MDWTKVKLVNGLSRARGAIERHGLRALAVIAVRVLFGQGLGQTLKLAAGDQPFLSVVSASPEDPTEADGRWPPRLDGQGAVSAAAWERWLGLDSHKRIRGSAPLASPALTIVIARAAGCEPEGLARTKNAIAALDIAAPDFAPAAEVLYVCLQAGDVPVADFHEQLRAAMADGEAQIVTFDLFRRFGDRVQPILMPGANPTQLAARDYFGSRAAVKGSVLLQSRGAPPREAILAWCARRSVAQIRAGWRHIGRPLLCIADDQRDPMPSPPAPGAPRRVVGAARHGVSAMICTRDKGHLTRQLVRQLLALDKDHLAEVVILSNGTTNPHALRTLADLAADPRVRVIRDDAPFNFSRLCNRGVRETRGAGSLLFLNDDVAPVSEDWLAALSDQLAGPQTGAVGPLLLYPNETVQCAGIYLRFPSGVGHVLRGATLPQDDPLGLAAAAREVSCLTGAVLLTDRAAFRKVGGFDEALALSFQDVDYGLKLHQLGLRNVFEPRSVLIHMESVSLDKAGSDPAMLLQRHREKTLFMARWGSVFPTDPFYPAGLDLDDESGRRLSRR